VRVLVVDDAEPFRALLRDLVEAAPGMTCAGEAESGEAALEVLEALAPDLVIMDKRMPGIGGVEAARRMRDLRPRLVVVLVSIETPQADALEASGAAAFLAKRELAPSVLADLWRAHGRR
jgi:DNA-binding NarL/FixJ family response regulator